MPGCLLHLRDMLPFRLIPLTDDELPLKDPTENPRRKGAGSVAPTLEFKGNADVRWPPIGADLLRHVRYCSP